MRGQNSLILAAALTASLLAGCAGSPLAAERSAREQVTRVGVELLAASKPALPPPRADAPPGEFVRYAVFNHPAVVAAYHEWRAAVETIAPARALPDPQFTFEADIADALMTLMPGLMFDFMTPGKRAAMGREAAAASNVAYRAYAAAVLRTAAEARKAWIELAYAEEARRLYLASISILGQALDVAGADYATGRTMGTLEGQVRLQNQIAEHHAHHRAVSERLAAARARFKSALGLAPGAADPPWPQPALAATTLPAENELWRRAQAANPELGRMRAMVEMAVAGVEVARKAGTPDFTLGAMADLKAAPLMVRPTASVTLPIWRDKIAATIATAEARREAAIARLSAEQLNLAAELAQMLYMVREADRMLAYIDGTALPNLDRLAASAEAGYQSGAGSAAMIVDARHMALLMQLERIEVLRQREAAATDLMLLTADVAPTSLPLLTETAANQR